jgi:SM-20-related protein
MITVKDNVLPLEALKACAAWLEAANWSYGWPSNRDMPFGHWNVDITKTGVANPTDVSDRLLPSFKEVWDALNKSFYGGEALLVRAYSNRHTFGTEGYIHTDTKREEDHTCVIYMNKEWEADWGGETTFYNEDKTEIIKSVLPKFGRIAAFPGTIYHKAAPVSRICSKVRTTLMFKAAIDPKAVYSAEVLLDDFLKSLGADKKPHKNGSLKDHLIRVFHLLKSAGAGDVLALVGGLHSVYGTNAYKSACLPLDSTEVSKRFGTEVDRLVRLFNKVDRPRVLERPDGSLNDRDLFLLRCIECANLYDQQELNPQKYPNLYEFAVQLRKGMTNGN